MFRIQVLVQLVDTKTGEVAKSRHGGDPIEYKMGYYPLFDLAETGHGATHALSEVITKAMHLGTELYRAGGVQVNC